MSLLFYTGTFFTAFELQIVWNNFSTCILSQATLLSKWEITMIIYDDIYDDIYENYDHYDDIWKCIEKVV